MSDVFAGPARTITRTESTYKRVPNGGGSRSTYDFMAQVIGYDLASFFQRNSEALRAEIDAVLRALLTPDTP